jgi:hypothetical protein
MSRLPRWLPHPAALISALLLTLFAGLLAWVAARIASPIDEVMRHSLRLGVLLAVAAAASPVVFLALVHSTCSGVVVDRFLGSSRGRSPGGVVPGVLSWYSGLFSCGVVLLASMVSLSVSLLWSPEEGGQAWSLAMSRLMVDPSPFASLRAALTLPGFAWFVSAAYLFHSARAVERRWREAR